MPTALLRRDEIVEILRAHFEAKYGPARIGDVTLTARVNHTPFGPKSIVQAQVDVLEEPSASGLRLAILRKLEWSHGPIDGVRFCPLCLHSEAQGHKSSCELGEVLKS